MNELDLLAHKYKTDKRTNKDGESGNHGFTLIYNSLLEYKRLEYKNILEIGVEKGSSLKMWYDYFPNAMIYGIDNFGGLFLPEIIALMESIQNDRIKIFVGDQVDDTFSKKVFKDIEFDLIIDDGGHSAWQQQISFKNLFQNLKSNCYYIIEDVGVSLIREYRQFDGLESSTVGWLKSIVSGKPFSYYITDEEFYPIITKINTISFNDEIGIILKK